MKQLIFQIEFLIGQMLSYIYPIGLSNFIHSLRDKIYTGYICKSFCHFGHSIIMWHPYTLKGLQYITIGDNNVFESDLQLTAQVCDSNNNPQIIIGNGCLIRRGAHITATNKICIGDNLLTGTNIYITDNSHGNTDLEMLSIPPRDRIIISKGPVLIGNNVWLGNNVSIMPGVSIGDGAVIGANAVVTHDIPPYSVAVGLPAKVI